MKWNETFSCALSLWVTKPFCLPCVHGRYGTAVKLGLMSGTYQPWPSILLGLAVCVQGFSQVALKHRMIAGDEEYHEPNRLLGMSITAFVIFVLILALGAAWLR